MSKPFDERSAAPFAAPQDPGNSLDLNQRDKTPVRNLALRLWHEHIKKHWPWLVVAVVLMSIEGSALGLFAWFVQPMFEALTGDSSMQSVTAVAFAVGGLFVIRAIAGFAQRMIIAGVGLRIVASLQMRMLRRLLSLDSAFFQHNAPGALIERVRGDAQSLRSAVASALLTIGRDVIALLSLFTVMMITDWLWTVLTLIGIPLLIFPMRAIQKWIKKTARQSRNVSALLTMRLDEIFHGIQTIKLNRLENHEDNRFERDLQSFLKFSLRTRAGSAANPALIDILSAVGFTALLIAGGQSIISGERTVGEFMSFFTALGLMFEPMRRLAAIAGQIQVAAVSAERIYTLFEMRPEILSPTTPRPMSAGDVVFDDVHFAYTDMAVLRGLSFTAKAGETTAIVGASGAGKTTVFAALTRLVDPQSGRISVGGTSVQDVELTDLRDTIAVVGQDTALFDESIAENIRMGAMNASDDDIQSAARAAEVLEFAKNLPNGLDTSVGPRGSNLSGGQRQRVAIARGMLKAAPILLLDEPTSALDAKSEKLVGAALDRLAEGRTTLVIAHRLSTIRSAHKIIVLDQGRVVEEGTHETLLAQNGTYARLHAMQITGTDDQ